MSAHGLTFGSLDLSGDDAFAHDDGYWFEVTAAGTSWGAPEAITRVVTTLLADGDLVEYDRDGNRIVTINVLIKASDSLALALGEAALSRELRKQNTVTWTPPDGWGPRTVFPVVTSWMDHNFDDLGELLRTERSYALTLTCEPHARSEFPVIAEPLSVGGSPIVTVFDTCDTATGWSATVDGVPDNATTFWEAGSVGVAIFDNPDGDADTVVLTRTGAVDFTGTPYLIVEAKVTSNSNKAVEARANGVLLPLIDMRVIGAGHIEYTYLAPAASVSSLSFTHVRPAPDAWLGLLVYDLTKSNMPPGATSHQISRIVPISGTQRTTGSVHVESPSPMGPTVIHASPEEGSGYSPPLRRWRTGGNTVTTSGGMMSGASEPLRPNSVEVRVPNSATPEDDYLLAGFINSSVAGSTRIFYTVRTLAPDGSVHSEMYDESTVHTFNTAGLYDFVPLGIVRLPVGVHNAGVTQIQIQQDVAAPATLTLDEAWIFRVGEESSLTVISDAKEHVWLDTPSLTAGVTREWTGTAPDRTDAYFPGLAARGNLSLNPDRVAVFVAALYASYPDVTIEHYARWHTHAAE